MSSEIKLITLSNYVRPTLDENKSRNWVMNGIRNEFYQTIIDRYNGSPTNAAVINSYVDLIYGRGLSAKNQVRNVSDWVKLKTVLKPKELRKIISDFELFGEFSFQITESKGKELSSITHIPKQRVIPSIENEDEEIETYWYSKNWAKYQQVKNAPEEFEAFNGQKQAQSIYVGKPYKAGKNYFADPDYLAGLPYCEMEEEIANLYVNTIKNGLSAGYIINVPNGKAWDTETKDKFEKAIKAKLVGSPNGGTFVLSFNDSDVSTTIEAIPINAQVHKQWEYLTQEARQQILTAHRVTSPMLFGIKDNTGFGNNADELDTAEAQLMKRVVAPKQNFILDALEEVLDVYGINLSLQFLPLTEVAEVAEVDKVELSEKKNDLETFIGLGEDYDGNEEYYLVNESEVDYEEEEKLSLELSSTGTARPNAKSQQDNKDIIVRYRYVDSSGKTKEQSATGERGFCEKMLAAGKVYRMEDVIQMETKAVNPGWGEEGADTYSIWLYKGGGNCHHKWNRVVYLKKGVKVDVNSPLAKTISTSEARSRGYKVETNENLVSIAPINMPNQGFLNK
jgi:hypothetical protein